MNRNYNRGPGARGPGSGAESAGISRAFPKTALFCIIGLLLLIPACGKKMTPYAPDRILPAFHEGLLNLAKPGLG